MNGWIKIYRQLMEKGYYTDSEFVHLWIHLLLRANHSQKEAMIDGRMIHLLPGQFITGRNTLSLETGIHESKIERILNCFEREQQIEQQKTNKFRLILVKNWEGFQISEQQSEQQLNNKKARKNSSAKKSLSTFEQVNAKEKPPQSEQQTNNKRTTDEQQTNTNNNNKNERMKEVIVKRADARDDINQVFDIFYEFNPGINYGNKTARRACEWLIDYYGLTRVVDVARFVGQIRGLPYAPRISTPYQLKEKWADLETFALAEKQKQQSKHLTITDPTL